jgi:hypothetical protein
MGTAEFLTELLRKDFLDRINKIDLISEEQVVSFAFFIPRASPPCLPFPNPVNFV